MLSRTIFLASLMLILPLVALAAPSKNEKDMKGPVFVKEPENRIGKN